MSKKALKLALDWFDKDGEPDHHPVVTAIKEALAQPEQEPFGWVVEHKHGGKCFSKTMAGVYTDTAVKVTAVYTTPPQPEQEPVAWMRHDGARVTTAEDRKNYPDYETRYSIPLYTTPPQPTPLADEQWQVIADTLGCFITRTQKDAIEAVIGIKGDTC